MSEDVTRWKESSEDHYLHAVDKMKSYATKDAPTFFSSKLKETEEVIKRKTYASEDARTVFTSKLKETEEVIKRKTYGLMLPKMPLPSLAPN
jgi:hypothetical protein